MSNPRGKRYKIRAATFDEAYRQMRTQLGEHAVVMNTAELPMKGVLGLLGRTYVEVTARVDAAPTTPNAQPAAPTTANPRKTSAAERRYTHGLQTAGSLAREPEVEQYEQMFAHAQERIQNAERPKPVAVPTPTSDAQESVVQFPNVQDQTDTSSASVDSMRRQMQDMREMLQVLMAESPAGGLPPEMAPHYQLLLESGVERTLAADIIAKTAQDGGTEFLRDEMAVRERIRLEIRKRTNVITPPSGGFGRAKFVSLVGATGVGKTTNLAKLAARSALNQGQRVALLTADTYRVGAADQLSKYANIIGLPIKVVHDATEMAAARKEFANYDVVYMDTAGGSQFNTRQVQELKLVLTAAQPDETYLVLSANTQYEDMKSMAANFGCLKPNGVIFTKLDETRRFGPLLSLLAETSAPLAFLSTGQNVPDDLLAAHPGMIANLVLEGRDRRGRPSTIAS